MPEIAPETLEALFEGRAAEVVPKAVEASTKEAEADPIAFEALVEESAASKETSKSGEEPGSARSDLKKRSPGSARSGNSGHW